MSNTAVPGARRSIAGGGMVVRTLAEEACASVLCWMATVSPEGVPNVSPKEVFALVDADTFVVADIASPVTVRNLRTNPQACVSFVDVFCQTGYKLVGRAEVIAPRDARFAALAAPLVEITGGQFPIRHVLRLTIDSTAPIIAPSYWLHPGRSVADRIHAAMQTYGVQPVTDAAPRQFDPKD